MNVSLPSHFSQLYTMLPLARDQFPKSGNSETDQMNEKELRGLGRKKEVISYRVDAFYFLLL